MKRMNRTDSNSAWRYFIACIALVTIFYAFPATAAQMVSNMGEPNDSYYAADYIGPEAQGFTTDGFSYQLTSVTIEIVPVEEGGDDSGNFTLRIFNDDSGLPGNMIPNGLLTGPGNPSLGEHTYTASGVISLAPNTTYWVVAQVSSGDGNYGVSFTASLSQTGAWSIIDHEAYSEDAGATWEGDSGVMRMRISADATDAVASIPTLNEWGVVLLSLLMAGSACWYIRRKGMTII